jgi:hypothetical protein
VDIDDAVVQKDDLFGQCKPDSRAGLVPAFGFLRLVKTVENVDDLFLGYADSRIFHRYFNIVMKSLALFWGYNQILWTTKI